jgi:hypothetical protein
MDKSRAVHTVAGGKTIHEPRPAGRYQHQPAGQSQTNQENNYRRFMSCYMWIQVMQAWSTAAAR